MPSPTPESTPLESGDSRGTSAGERLQQSLLQLWKTSKPTLEARLETIRCAQTLLEKNALDQQTRSQAEDAAHNLAGILGTFGLPVGTDLARQIEAGMEKASGPGQVDARALALALEQLSKLISLHFAAQRSE